MDKTVTMISRSYSDEETVDIVTSAGKLSQVKNLVILPCYKSSCIKDLDSSSGIKFLREYSVYDYVKFQHMVNEAVRCSTDYVVIINDPVRFEDDALSIILKNFESRRVNILVGGSLTVDLSLFNSCFLDGHKFVILKKNIIEKLNGMYFSSLINLVFLCFLVLKESATVS